VLIIDVLSVRDVGFVKIVIQPNDKLKNSYWKINRKPHQRIGNQHISTSNYHQLKRNHKMKNYNY